MAKKLTKEMKDLKEMHRFFEGEQKAYKKMFLKSKEQSQFHTKRAKLWNKQYKSAGRKKIQTKKKIDALSKK